MPTKKSNKTKTTKATKKYNKSKKKYYKKKTYIPSISSIISSSKKVVRLPFSEYNVFAPGEAVSAIQLKYQANSIFNPSNTSVSYPQPSGMDYYRSLFNHYTVLGSKITVKFQSAASEETKKPMILGIILDDDNTASYADPRSLRESPYFRYRNTIDSSTFWSGKNNIMCTNKFSAKKFFNVTNPNDVTERIGAPINSDPSERAYFIVTALITDQSSATFSPIHVDVKIDYIVQFSEPKEQQRVVYTP